MRINSTTPHTRDRRQSTDGKHFFHPLLPINIIIWNWGGVFFFPRESYTRRDASDRRNVFVKYVFYYGRCRPAAGRREIVGTFRPRRRSTWGPPYGLSRAIGLYGSWDLRVFIHHDVRFRICCETNYVYISYIYYVRSGCPERRGNVTYWVRGPYCFQNHTARVLLLF